MSPTNLCAAAKCSLQVYELGTDACLYIVFVQIINVDGASDVWRLNNVVEFLFVKGQAERMYLRRGPVRKKRGEHAKIVGSRVEVIEVAIIVEVALLTITGGYDM